MHKQVEENPSETIICTMHLYASFFSFSTIHAYASLELFNHQIILPQKGEGERDIE